MKSKELLFTFSFLLVNLLSFSQQIGDGLAPIISDFTIPLQSGVYNGFNANGTTPDADPWQHLLVIRHPNINNNHQLQLVSSFAGNDRLFFRKIASGNLSSQNPSWNEIATRGANTFSGNQIINGNVGIGTPNIAQKLSVYDSNFGIASFLGGKVSGNYQYSQIYIGQQLTQGYGANIGYMAHQTDQTASGFYMTNYGELEGLTGIFIKKGGNVGIGTTIPIEKLHVFGNIVSGNVNGQDGGLFLGNSSHGIKRIANNVEMYTHGADGNLLFSTYLNQEKMRIIPNGNVGIGSINPDQKLTVKGKIHAEEIIVDLSVPADYVFQKYYTGKSELKSDYVMPTLAEIENFAKKNNHLPNVPSAKEIQQKGVSLGEMSNILLQKVEELTLYAIEQNKKVILQQEELERLKIENEKYKSLAERLSAIENALKK